MPRKTNNSSAPAKTLRCAIYTRKSTEEGLEQEFNSLDAQRESGEAYIKAQMHEGWRIVEDHYDDGGFTGGNMERPALKRLMADIEAGKVDCVIVYKVDRLSRSLMDFARMMEVFEKVQRRIRIRHAAVQYEQLDGALDAERAPVLRTVRTRIDQRAHPRQDRRGEAKGKVCWRFRGARL